MRLTWLGHASWLIEIASHRILLDPFITDNPAAKISVDELVGIEHVLVSHGHHDHVADVATIANRCAATVIANFEIASWFAHKYHVKHTIGMNIGGGIHLPWGRVEMTNAIHSSSLPDGSYGGNPGGFVIEAGEKRVYFACDTALFSDMQLIGQSDLDAAVLPIGDLFTMGPDDSIRAIGLLNPRMVLPTHYGTWPPIAQDAKKWAEKVDAKTQAKAVVLAVGESVEI